MKVSAENFKIIPLKRFLIFYFVFLATLFISYLLIQEDIFKSLFLEHSFVLFCYILMAFLGLGLMLYGLKILKHRQSPPAQTWVFSSWQVISGSKACKFGWLAVSCGLFLAFSYIYQTCIYLSRII